ncbi:MAG: GNAT family N-acetyltransferase [Boseongicola sp.]
MNELVVVLDPGEVIGFASGTVLMHPDKQTSFFVNEVGVHDDYQQQGIAVRLIERIFDLARERGCEGIWLGAEVDNEPARALCRKLDGRGAERQAMYEWDGEEI